MNPLEMHAQWIWCRGEERPKNFYLHVRRSFRLTAGIRRAIIRVTADSRYQLFVNGIFVARGPARCDRRWQCLDQWDITEHLTPGVNVIAALVHHYGEWTFAYMLGRGGFFARADVDLADGQGIELGTDESWRVRPSLAWERNLPRMSIQTGYPEIYDARKEMTGWTDPGYDDGDWELATVLGPVGVNPWPRLAPREIPAMMDLPLNAERVLDWGEVGRARIGHYLDLLRVAWSTKNGVGYLLTFVWSPVEMNGEIHAGSQEAIRLWINGELLISHLVTRDPAPDQEIVPVMLRAGWNAVAAKIVQGEGQWHFYFRIEGGGSDHLVYSRTQHTDPGEADSVSPWWFLGPFQSRSVEEGFTTQFPPEQEFALDRPYAGNDGAEIRWIPAGVSQESMLTSVVMSREPRTPARSQILERPEGLISPGSPALFSPGGERGSYAVIDFGKEVAGYPVIEIDRALGGEIIDMGYAEVLQTPEGDVLAPAEGKTGIVNPDRAGVHYADRYVCKPGKQRYQTFDKRAFRYLQLDVRNLRQPIEIGPASIILSTYPVSYHGAFSCSDALLNRIWEVGRYTVQLNMEDAYTDCPWRERGQWWGDARVQALVNYYAFGDLRLVRHGLRQIAQSQTDEGLTMGVYPTDWTYGILPTFTLLWIVSLRDYYEFSGDLDIVGELFPAVERAIGYFEGFRSDHDLLKDLPYWLFVDWADVETAGESASVNALYHGALLATAEMAGALGFTGKSREYKGLAEGIRSGIERFLWDPSVQCFRDAWKGDEAVMKISEQANCWAIVFGAAREGIADTIMETLFVGKRAAVQCGTPYFAFYALCALARTGRHKQLLEYIRTHWGMMLEWGATTWWETWEAKGSFCHGWSSGPNYILQAEILGVKPGSPGWETILITPHPAGLAWARGSVPTPRGTVSVEWNAGKEFSLQVSLPAPARVTVPIRPGGIVAVTKDDTDFPAEVKRERQESLEVTLLLPDPATYRIHTY